MDDYQYLADLEKLAVLVGRPADDPKLLLELQRASDRFRGEVGHQVTLVKGDTAVLNGEGGQTLTMPAFPVSNVSITLDGRPVVDFETDADNGILRRRRGWPDGLGNVTAVYDHGFAEVPGDVADAVLEMAEIALTSSVVVQQRGIGISTVTFGQQATTGVTQRWADAVARYRR